MGCPVHKHDHVDGWNFLFTNINHVDGWDVLYSNIDHVDEWDVVNRTSHTST
jgi:hypothetical protein